MNRRRLEGGTRIDCVSFRTSYVNIKESKEDMVSFTLLCFQVLWLHSSLTTSWNYLPTLPSNAVKFSCSQNLSSDSNIQMEDQNSILLAVRADIKGTKSDLSTNFSSLQVVYPVFLSSTVLENSNKPFSLTLLGRNMHFLSFLTIWSTKTLLCLTKWNSN